MDVHVEAGRIREDVRYVRVDDGPADELRAEVDDNGAVHPGGALMDVVEEYRELDVVGGDAPADRERHGIEGKHGGARSVGVPGAGGDLVGAAQRHGEVDD